MLQSFSFSNLCVSVLKRWENSPSSPGLGMGGVAPGKTYLHRKTCGFVRQVGKRQIFSAEKYWARWFFMCFNTQWSSVHGKGKKLHLQGCFVKKKKKKKMHVKRMERFCYKLRRKRKFYNENSVWSYPLLKHWRVTDPQKFLLFPIFTQFGLRKV